MSETINTATQAEQATFVDCNRVNHIINLLKNNAIKVPKKFEELLTAGAYASISCRETAEVIYEKIFDAFRFSMLDGNLSNRKSSITSLIDIWSELTSPDCLKKFSKLQSKVTNTNIDAIKKEQKMFKEKVISYIDSTIDGATYILSKNPTNPALVEDGIQMLVRIKDNVQSAVDDCSIVAHELATLLVGQDKDNSLHLWRKDLAYDQLTAFSISNLDYALQQSLAWKNNTSISKRNFKGKVPELTIQSDKLDEESNLLKLEAQADIFFDKLKKKHDDMITAVITAPQSINNTQQRLAEIDSELDRLAFDYDNGKIDAQALTIKSKVLEQEHTIRSRTLLTDQANYSSRLRLQEQTLSLLQNYMILYNYYEAYKNFERSKLYEVFKDINFYSYLAVIDGSLNEADITLASQQIHAVLIYATEATKIVAEQNNHLASRLNPYLANETDKTQRKTAEQEAQDFINRRKARKGNSTTTNDQEEHQPQVEIPLSNQDN